MWLRDKAPIRLCDTYRVKCSLLFIPTYYNLNERTVVTVSERSTNGMLAKRGKIACQTLEPITSSADGYEVNLVSIAIDLLNHKCLTLVNYFVDQKVNNSSHCFHVP